MNSTTQRQATLSATGKQMETNKTTMNRIKKRLKKAKDKWVEEVSSVLWAYQTTPQKATNEMLYYLAFNFEIIQLEVGSPTIRTKAYDDNHNTEVLDRASTLIICCDCQHTRNNLPRHTIRRSNIENFQLETSL